jgi:hypothetical protein
MERIVIYKQQKDLLQINNITIFIDELKKQMSILLFQAN